MRKKSCQFCHLRGFSDSPQQKRQKANLNIITIVIHCRFELISHRDDAITNYTRNATIERSRENLLSAAIKYAATSDDD